MNVLNPTTLFVGSLAGIALVGGLFVLARNSGTTLSTEIDDAVVSSSGIHWHPEISVSINGQPYVIPSNLGIGMQYAGYPTYDPMMMMTTMHTHDTSGQIHWEVMEGPVTERQVTLGSFFGLWGRTFNKDCIFEYCTGEGGTVSMFVNGEKNTAFEAYTIQDKDIIEIRYE